MIGYQAWAQKSISFRAKCIVLTAFGSVMFIICPPPNPSAADYQYPLLCIMSVNNSAICKHILRCV